MTDHKNDFDSLEHSKDTACIRMKIKKDLRRRLIGQRKSMPLNQADVLSRRICTYILQWPIYRKAEIIFAYYPCHQEVNLLPVIEDAIRHQKQVAFPRVCGPRQMDFFLIRTLDELESGYMGIYEPKRSCPEIRRSQKDTGTALMFVPGTAFCQTADGIGRMGYGGGYYDTYLQNAVKNIDTCGIAYDFQVVPADQLLPEAHDILLDHLITEKTELTRKKDVSEKRCD